MLHKVSPDATSLEMPTYHVSTAETTADDSEVINIICTFRAVRRKELDPRVIHLLAD